MGPIVDYRVIFWTGAGESTEYDLLGADDVHAAIARADAEARSRARTYTLYAKVRSSQGAGLVWLALAGRALAVNSRSGDIPAHWPSRGS
jgi:hypothetical protein